MSNYLKPNVLVIWEKPCVEGNSCFEVVGVVVEEPEPFSETCRIEILENPELCEGQEKFLTEKNTPRFGKIMKVPRKDLFRV